MALTDWDLYMTLEGFRSSDGAATSIKQHTHIAIEQPTRRWGVHYYRQPDHEGQFAYFYFFRNDFTKSSIHTLGSMDGTVILNEDPYPYQYEPNKTYFCGLGFPLFSFDFINHERVLVTQVPQEILDDPLFHAFDDLTALLNWMEYGIVDEEHLVDDQLDVVEVSDDIPDDSTDSDVSSNNGKPTDDIKSNDTNDDGITPLACIGAMNCYVMSLTKLAAFIQYMWNDLIKEETWASLINTVLGLYGDLRQCIVNVVLYPFGVPRASTVENVILGRFETSVSENRVDAATNGLIGVYPSASGFKVSPIRNNYLDLSSKASVYIPFIGQRDVDMTLIYDRYIRFKVFCDYTTGQYDVYMQISQNGSNWFTLDVYSTAVGMNIPVCLDSGKDLMQRVLEKGYNTASGVVTARTGVGVGGEIPQSSNTYSTTGTVSNGLISKSPNKFMLKLEIPIAYRSDGYGKFIGYPVERKYVLNELRGFTVCENVYIAFGNTKHDNVVVMPTSEMVSKLKDLLESGVYL